MLEAWICLLILFIFSFDKISYIKILWTKESFFFFWLYRWWKTNKRNSVGIQCYVKNEPLSKICLNKFMHNLLLILNESMLWILSLPPNIFHSQVRYFIYAMQFCNKHMQYLSIMFPRIKQFSSHIDLKGNNWR